MYIQAAYVHICSPHLAIGCGMQPIGRLACNKPLCSPSGLHECVRRVFVQGACNAPERDTEVSILPVWLGALSE
jgi:hypothetical protein